MTWWKDLIERAGSSAAQQFIAVVLAAGGVATVTGLPWKVALATSAGAALVSILLTLAQFATGAVLPFWTDLLIRVGKTFAASLLGYLGAGAVNVLTVHWTAALNIAGVAALLAFLKGFLGPNIGSPTLVPLDGRHVIVNQTIVNPRPEGPTA